MLQNQFKFDNYSLRIGTRGKQIEWFTWKVFISNDEPVEKLDNVRSVEYMLPESFPDPIRLVENRDSRFALISSGWGEFPIFITVYLKDNTEILLKYRLDLNKRWPLDELMGINLQDADLKDANLSKANLSKANLRSSNLIGANLSDADLTNAKLVRAKIKGAILRGASLSEADLSFADLTEADLKNAKLQKSILKDAVLFRAWFTDANLEGAILPNAALNSAHLEGANLKNSDITGADLKHAFFDKKTDFQGVIYNSITIDCLKDSNWWDAIWDKWVFDKIREKYGKK